MNKHDIEVVRARLLLAEDKANNSNDKSTWFYIDFIKDLIACLNNVRPEVPASITQTATDIYFACGECGTYLSSIFPDTLMDFRPRFCSKCGAKIYYGSREKDAGDGEENPGD